MTILLCVNEYFALILLLSLPIGYFLGSIPFGLVLTKIFSKTDIRKIGSGNIGTTNVLRTGSKKLALATLILDGAKAGLLILLVNLHIDPHFTCSDANASGYLLIGLFAILGHCFPIWLKFKGGKGVATGLGALLAAVPYAGLAACAAWIATAKISKYSSLSALIAFLIAPIVTLFIYGTDPAPFCALITLLIWVRHKDNIKRLLKGEEPKIGQKKKEESVDPVSE